MELVKGGWKQNYHFAVVLCLNWKLVVLFFLCKLYNNWLCTSTDVQAGFVILFLKKYVYLNNAIVYCQIIQFMKAAH